MSTINERILEYLSQHPEGVDDDELARALNLKSRQQANNRCRRLTAKGFVERREVGGKLRNFLLVEDWADAIPARSEPPEDRPWFWEGHIQDRVAEYLREKGYRISRLADTARYEPGKDIEAEGDSGPLWVTVKGYPKGTSRTPPTTQAGHWFKNALFDIIVWRGESPDAKLAMALPDFPKYRKLTKKVTWFQSVANFFYIWVQEDGSVEE